MNESDLQCKKIVSYIHIEKAFLYREMLRVEQYKIILDLVRLLEKLKKL
jgi:hypothetical protein